MRDPNGLTTVAAAHDEQLNPEKPKGKIEDIFGCLADKVKLEKPLSIEEMNEIIAAGWAGEIK